MKQREMQECGIDIINLVMNKYHLTYQEAFFMLAAIGESLAQAMQEQREGGDKCQPNKGKVIS